METSAVLTMVVSIVERKSAIQSLPTVSLCTAPKIDSPGFEGLITQVSTCATSSLEYRQDLVALPPLQLTWVLPTGHSQYLVAEHQVTKVGKLLITKTVLLLEDLRVLSRRTRCLESPSKDMILLHRKDVAEDCVHSSNMKHLVGCRGWRGVVGKGSRVFRRAAGYVSMTAWK